MSKKRNPIVFLAAACACLPSCNIAPPEIATVPLGDAVIAFAKEARRAGANQMTYTASVTVAKYGEASLAVPVGPASVGIGGNTSKEATSTVEIVVPIEQTARKSVSGQQLLLNRSTNRLRAAPSP